MTEEVQKMCSTCQNGEERTGVACRTRSGCFTPNYDNWEPIGAETEDTGCTQCGHWRAVKIGKFCPDCSQALK